MSRFRARARHSFLHGRALPWSRRWPRPRSRHQGRCHRNGRNSPDGDGEGVCRCCCCSLCLCRFCCGKATAIAVVIASASVGVVVARLEVDGFVGAAGEH
eukprot:12876517-Alexandrium_andersonii.AAC.1